jgi:hypothetical protein
MIYDILDAEKMPPLHNSLQKIERERVNVQKRTEAKIALLFSQSKNNNNNNNNNREERDWHCCVNIFCFCLLLLTEPSVFAVAIH